MARATQPADRPTPRDLIHGLRYYRPIGSRNLSALLAAPIDEGEGVSPLTPCGYVQRFEMPRLANSYALQIPASQRGAPGAPRYSPADDFYPVLEMLARELAWCWRREKRQYDSTLASRDKAPVDLVHKARQSPDGAAAELIGHYRGVKVSTETLKRQLTSYRLQHPGKTIAQVRTHLRAIIDTFLAICPPEA